MPPKKVDPAVLENIKKNAPSPPSSSAGPIDMGRGERKTPLRSFRSQVGILHHGNFFVAHSVQLSETGIRLEVPMEFEDKDHAVVSFFLPGEGSVSHIGSMAHLNPNLIEPGSGQHQGHFLVDVNFENLSLGERRTIRKYVSLKSEDETSGRNTASTRLKDKILKPNVG